MRIRRILHHEPDAFCESMWSSFIPRPDLGLNCILGMRLQLTWVGLEYLLCFAYNVFNCCSSGICLLWIGGKEGGREGGREGVKEEGRRKDEGREGGREGGKGRIRAEGRSTYQRVGRLSM